MSTTRTPLPGSSAPADEAGRVFHLLGQLFLEAPDEETLSTVATWASRWLETDPGESVAVALEPIAAAEPEDAERLTEEFTRLFRGVLPGSPDPPYESLYRDGALEGPSGAAVRSAYRSAGIDVAPDSGELADHLGIELHFVGALRERGDREAAASFVADHPRQYFDHVAETVRDHDPAPFYDGVLTLTAIALAAEVEG